MKVYEFMRTFALNTPIKVYCGERFIYSQNCDDYNSEYMDIDLFDFIDDCGDYNVDFANIIDNVLIMKIEKE